jgi:integrase
MKKMLKYVDPVCKPNGMTYFYFRRQGRRTPLPGAYNSPEFLQAYWALRKNSAAVEIGAERTIPGTVNAAIVLYYKHPSFTRNKPITQQTDRNILEAFRVKHGDKRIALLQEHHIEAMIGEKAGKPAAQRNLLRVLRSLLKVSVKAKLRRDNPALGVELERLETTGYHSWTEEELRQYEARHPVGTKARLALDLLLYTAQRRADVVRLGPSMMATGDGEQRLRFVQSKTDVEMDIPVAEPLAATIAATPMIGVKTFLVTEYGRPFTAAGFGNWFRDRCNEAELPQCSAHGLRKAFLRRMAEAGCSEDYIASISGHRDLREIRKYVQAANKAKMATAGMARTLAMFPAKSGAGQ